MVTINAVSLGIDETTMTGGGWDPSSNTDVDFSIGDSTQQLVGLMQLLLHQGDLRGLGLSAQGENVGNNAAAVFSHLRSLSSLDITYDTGKVFNTECASPHPLALMAYLMFADRNAVKEQHPSLKLMEESAINWMAELLHHPTAKYFPISLDDTVDLDKSRAEIGYLPSGGTAANIIAFWAMRNYDRINGKSRNKILIPADAHYSKYKLEDLLGLETVVIRVDENFQLDIDHLEQEMGPDVLGVFATAGSSRLGVVQPIERIAQIAARYDAYVHVDAAFGGFILPFLEMSGEAVAPWDFRIPNVFSITLDPHKMGMAPLGAGAIIFRDPEYVNSYRTKVDFPKIDNITLEGSRSGGPIAATYFMTQYFGIEGYMNTVQRMIRQRDLFIEKVLEIEESRLVTKSDINAVGVTFGSQEKNAYVLRELKREGYQISGLRSNSGLRFIFHGDHKDQDIIDLSGSIKTIVESYM